MTIDVETGVFTPDPNETAEEQRTAHGHDESEPDLGCDDHRASSTRTPGCPSGVRQRRPDAGSGRCASGPHRDSHQAQRAADAGEDDDPHVDDRRLEQQQAWHDGERHPQHRIRQADAECRAGAPRQMARDKNSNYSQ